MESMLQTCATRDRHRLSTLVRQLRRTRPDSADYPLLEQKVLDALEDHDDVKEVHTNAEFPE